MVQTQSISEFDLYSTDRYDVASVEDFRNAKILVAEDSPLDIGILSDALDGMAMLTVTTTAEEALAKAESGVFDLILLDIMIPDMGGFELCRKIKANKRLKDIPVIFITSLDSTESEEKGLGLGAADYITKPFAPDVVRVRVQNQIALARTTRELRKTNEKLALLAVTDPLTGVFNRRQFENLTQGWLTHQNNQDAQSCLLMLDLDYFKAVNDQYGHGAGDAVLRGVTKTWSDTLRSGDVIGRVGGEEFAIFLPSTSKEQAEIIANRLCERTRDTAISFSGQYLSVSVSIGLAICSKGHPPYVKLMELADQALYTAKDNGRDRVEINKANVVTPKS